MFASQDTPTKTYNKTYVKLFPHFEVDLISFVADNFEYEITLSFNLINKTSPRTATRRRRTNSHSKVRSFNYICIHNLEIMQSIHYITLTSCYKNIHLSIHKSNVSILRPDTNLLLLNLNKHSGNSRQEIHLKPHHRRRVVIQHALPRRQLHQKQRREP